MSVPEDGVLYFSIEDDNDGSQRDDSDRFAKEQSHASLIDDLTTENIVLLKDSIREDGRMRKAVGERPQQDNVAVGCAETTGYEILDVAPGD